MISCIDVESFFPIREIATQCSSLEVTFVSLKCLRLAGFTSKARVNTRELRSKLGKGYIKRFEPSLASAGTSTHFIAIWRCPPSISSLAVRSNDLGTQAMANTSGQPCRSSNTNLQNAEIKAVADYWRPLDFKHHCKKAGLEMLIELCGMKVPDGHSTRGELADILTRFCDGLPQNYHLTISELRTQVIWRNLLIEPHRTVNRAMCVRLLDQAEKSRTFPRFMDLPTELRELIYAFSLQPTMSTFGTQQPAISRVSRTVRVESLPVFYSS